jgi:hypothetical protein
MLEPKQLYKRLEAVFDGLESHGSSEHIASRLAPRVLDKLGLGDVVRVIHRFDEAGVQPGCGLSVELLLDRRTHGTRLREGRNH